MRKIFASTDRMFLAGKRSERFRPVGASRRRGEERRRQESSFTLRWKPSPPTRSKAAFEKKTGMQMEYWRGGSTEVLDRVLSEHRVGKPVFDVVAITGDHMRLMANEGAIGKYDSPSLKAFAKEAIDPSRRALPQHHVRRDLITKPCSRPANIPRLSKTSSNRNIAANWSCRTPPVTR